MRICIIAEGCYPYVVGGVSSWIQSLIKSFPTAEFVMLAIIPNRSWRGKFSYELPSNLVEVHELYLDDLDWYSGRKKRNRRKRRSIGDYNEFRKLILNQNTNWKVIFNMFQERGLSIDNILMGSDFLSASIDYYNLEYKEIVFSDFIWTMRSIYLPMFLTMKMKIPKADIYHCVSTGYAGILGSMAKTFYNSKLLISEHGIYTREREEELIKAKWVNGTYKNIWIEQFMKMSKLAYEKADIVTSLYEYARELQIELGCPEEKTMVTPNGISVENLSGVPGKSPEDEYINIGAILRVTPIKDVKTLIRAFYYAKLSEERLKLWIMGPLDEDEKYARECFELVEMMQIKDIVFTGRVDIKEYIGRMDFTILTSISEGQPLTILESYAVKKPVIATDVGNCKGLIYGDNDDFGEAGILTHIMNIEEVTQAILKLAHSPNLREQMGNNGYNRVIAKFKIEDMRKVFTSIYSGFATDLKLKWPS